jgi:N-acetylmuramoyl-L-alanine amidase
VNGATAYYSVNSPVNEGGYKLSRLILEEISNNTGLRNNGARTRQSSQGPNIDYYYVIRESKMPAIIVENAYHTNPEEERLLKTDEFRYRLAESIAKGIAEYFGQEWKENQ